MQLSKTAAKVRFGIFLTSVTAMSACTISPTPLTNEELRSAAARNTEAVNYGQEEVDGPIDLFEAIARALKYNLDGRLELMNVDLRSKEADLSSYDMLPNLVANATYEERHNTLASSSRSLRSGLESLETSTSTERDHYYGDITLSWDILDYGLSYYRANQAADEYLIAEEQKRRIVNRTIENVHTAYWRAVSAERLMTTLKGLRSEVADALAKSRAQHRDNISSPLAAMQYQRELLNIKEEIDTLKRELNLSKVQLATLMNLRVGSEFSLVVPERRFSSDELVMTLEEGIHLALINRPELREIQYRHRINALEEKVTYVEVIPNLKMFLGFNFDTNSFLANNTWVNWGARTTFDLMKVVSLGARADVVEAQGELLRARERALTMAIMTQVMVGRTRYEHLREELVTASELTVLQNQIFDQIEAGVKAGRFSRQTSIREKLNKVIAEAKHDVVYADLQNAHANIFAAMGLNIYGPDVTGEETIGELSVKLRDYWLDPANQI